jgi:hypothetical protein
MNFPEYLAVASVEIFPEDKSTLRIRPVQQMFFSFVAMRSALLSIFQGSHRAPPDALRFSAAEVARFQHFSFNLAGEGFHGYPEPGPGWSELAFMGVRTYVAAGHAAHATVGIDLNSLHRFLPVFCNRSAF